MKSILTFFFNNKKEYIGLSSFKPVKSKNQKTEKPADTIQKTSLTGLIRRIN